MVVKRIESSETSGLVYNVTIDKKNNYVSCNCKGFLNHGRCKHIRFYKDFIKIILYSSPIIAENLINNFKSVKEKVKYVLLEKQELLEERNYHKLFGTVIAYFPDIFNQETTIGRTFRWLKCNDPEIIPLVPIDTEVKSIKQEQVMHDIDQWEPNNVTSFAEKQTMLIEKEKFE